MNGLETKKMKIREKKRKSQRAPACMPLGGVSSGEERGGGVTFILFSSRPNAIILALTNHGSESGFGKPEHGENIA